MSQPELDVLYEDNHLLVINKPAQLATMGTAAGSTSLVTLAKAYLKTKYHKPGNVYVGVVSRLDAWVSGAVVLARTSKAAARLSDQFRQQQVEKRYWAAIAGQLQPPAGTLEDWLEKDERQHRMQVVPGQRPGARQARLHYQTLASSPGRSLLEIQLLTGRKHQIRIQLASRHHPILGDRKYGSRQPFPVGIALHSRQLSLTHPVRRQPLTIVAPLPASWRSLDLRPADEERDLWRE